MTPEEQARREIDQQLEQCGWLLQDRREMNISAGLGVAIREFSVRGGEADYLLYVAGKALGVIEAKPAGRTLSGVELQSGAYSNSLPAGVPAHRRPLPFCYESTGFTTRFTNRLDPNPRSREKPWTEKLWVYDLRTNLHFTLKTKPLRQTDLDDFVKCFHAENRQRRKPTWSDKDPEGRWRCFTYDELAKRDKLNLDIFWLKDKSLEDAENLPEPDELAEEIADDLETALQQFRAIANDLKG